MFETKLGIKPDLARAAIDKCQQAIGRLEREIEACSTELSTLETACCDLQARLRAQRSRPGAGSAEQMLQRYYREALQQKRRYISLGLTLTLRPASTT